MLTVALVSWRNGGAKSSRVCVRVYACLNALLSARYLYENLADDVVNAKCTSTPINRLFTIGRANMCTGYTNYAPPPEVCAPRSRSSYRGWRFRGSEQFVRQHIRLILIAGVRFRLSVFVRRPPPAGCARCRDATSCHSTTTPPYGSGHCSPSSSSKQIGHRLIASRKHAASVRFYIHIHMCAVCLSLWSIFVATMDAHAGSQGWQKVKSENKPSERARVCNIAFIACDDSANSRNHAQRSGQRSPLSRRRRRRQLAS